MSSLCPGWWEHWIFCVNSPVELVGAKMPLLSGCCQSLGSKAASWLQAESLKGKCSGRKGDWIYSSGLSLRCVNVQPGWGPFITSVCSALIRVTKFRGRSAARGRWVLYRGAELFKWDLWSLALCEVGAHAAPLKGWAVLLGHCNSSALCRTSCATVGILEMPGKEETCKQRQEKFGSVHFHVIKYIKLQCLSCFSF